VSSSVIDRVLAGVEEHGAALAAMPVQDTVKRESEKGFLASTVDRRGLWLAQTPQGFRVEVLREAFERALEDGFQGTDEASLVERLPGQEIVAVTASSPNPKITEPGDWELVEALLGVSVFGSP
jgi:2-C-methyl-D-erythritol 4-phosphate cytidylyltransferase